ncbi:uncharacterized protein AKAW2_30028A [Aspergillus luchuensis]|nr:uncharacterized protein AKAW2_30028A [Aspergillus luchuensis]BCR96709.1 hypothetical protein AKAW2_30028A [Aspergillus luchuensis]
MALRCEAEWLVLSSVGGTCHREPRRRQTSRHRDGSRSKAGHLLLGPSVLRGSWAVSPKCLRLHCSTRLLLGGCRARASSTGFPAALYSDADQFTRSSAVDAHTAGAVVFRIPRPLWHIPVPPADWLGPGDSLVG